MSYSMTCASCASVFATASPLARTCSAACRAALYRARLTAQRARLAAQAHAALASGDVTDLASVARRATLLHPA